MPKPKKGPRLGSGPAHQQLILSNLASDLFVHGRIKTTVTKAKTLRPYAEKLITKAKRGDLHARRQVLSQLRDRDVVAYLFEDVGPRFTDRNGGYTRILKLGPRPGDNAPMALIELVEQGAAGSGEEFVEAGRERRARGLFGRLRRKKDEPVGGFYDDYDDDDDLDEDVDAVDDGLPDPDNLPNLPDEVVDEPSAEEAASDGDVASDDAAASDEDQGA